MTKLLATAWFDSLEDSALNTAMIDDARGCVGRLRLWCSVVLAEVDHDIVLDECAERTMSFPMQRPVRYCQHYRRIYESIETPCRSGCPIVTRTHYVTPISR